MSGIIGVNLPAQSNVQPVVAPGQMLKRQFERDTGSGTSGSGASYPMTSPAFVPVSSNSTIKIECIISGKASTAGGIPVATARIRWSGYNGGPADEELCGHNEWGERTPNDDGNDRAQLDITTYQKNTSVASRTYSVYMYSEYVFSYGGGDAATWDSGDRYMIITEYAGAPVSASEMHG